MPYPDNFNAAAFDARHGTEASDRALAACDAWAALYVAHVAKLKAGAQSLLDLIDSGDTPIEPVEGYGVTDDIRDMVAQLAGVDLVAFEKRLVEHAMEAE